MPSILGIDLGVPEGGPVIWPACQGQMCPKGHRDHRICEMEMHPSREGWGKPREEREGPRCRVRCRDHISVLKLCHLCHGVVGDKPHSCVEAYGCLG